MLLETRLNIIEAPLHAKKAHGVAAKDFFFVGLRHSLHLFDHLHGADVPGRRWIAVRIIAADGQIMVRPKIADIFQRSFRGKSRNPDLVEEFAGKLAEPVPSL